MITKFGSLYAGHVDLDNLGLDGTPVNDRWLSDDHLASVFDKSEAIVLAMERLGYRSEERRGANESRSQQSPDV